MMRPDCVIVQLFSARRNGDTLYKSNMNNAEQLTQLLLRQRGFLRTVWEATEEEAALLARGRPMNELLPLLKRKAVLVACVEDLNKQILQVQKSLGGTPHDTKELEVEVKTLLQKILSQDVANQAKVK